ncbi:MAG: DUF393 domain-containing protein [Bdellovibrionota bacterium]
MENEKNSQALTIFFDGACHLCSFEIRHYQKIDQTGQLAFVDISDVAFDAKSYGLDPDRVQKIMHVRTPEGTVKTDVDAFLEIWKRFPSHAWMAKIISLPFIKPLAKIAYFAFARIRPWLPKRKTCSI